MDNKKFEQLIDLIINENEEQARALFHDIVVEKSREIYESMMDEEMSDDMEEGMGGQVGDLLDEIGAEEEGMTEEEEDLEIDSDEDEVVDIEADEEDEEGGEEDLEDRVVDLEDKLDQLMAEFEELMGGDEEAADMGDTDDEEVAEEMMEAADDEEEEEDVAESLEEAVQLQKVSVTHGDNGANTKSVSLTKPKVVATGANPVKFSGHDEAVPTSPKAPSNEYSKGETQVKGAGSFKNAPAQKSQDLEKAPAPKHGDDGQNTKSPLGESKKTVKKIVK